MDADVIVSSATRYRMWNVPRGVSQPSFPVVTSAEYTAWSPIIAVVVWCSRSTSTHRSPWTSGPGIAGGFGAGTAGVGVDVGSGVGVKVAVAVAVGVAVGVKVAVAVAVGVAVAGGASRFQDDDGPNARKEKPAADSAATTSTATLPIATILRRFTCVSLPAVGLLQSLLLVQRENDDEG
jgi:hypothetical protein